MVQFLNFLRHINFPIWKRIFKSDSLFFTPNNKLSARNFPNLVTHMQIVYLLCQITSSGEESSECSCAHTHCLHLEENDKLSEKIPWTRPLFTFRAEFQTLGKESSESSRAHTDCLKVPGKTSSESNHVHVHCLFLAWNDRLP